VLEKDDFNNKQIIVVFSSKGEKLSYKNSNVVITDKEGIIKYQISCYRIFSVFIIGEYSITSGIIKHAQRFNYNISMFTTNFRLYGSIGDRMQGNTLLHRKQYAYNGNEIADHIVIDKIKSEINILKDKRHKTPLCKEAITKLQEYIVKIEQEKPNIDRLRGIEGNAAKLYFANIFDITTWNGRRPREKRDIINSCLDIGYTMLFSMVEALLKIYDFDIYCGVYHREFYMRKSLVCDIMESMRTIIDNSVKKAITLKVVKEEDFKVYQGQYQIEYKKASVLISYIMEQLMKEKERMFVYIRAYYRAFMKGKEISEYPYFSELK